MGNPIRISTMTLDSLRDAVRAAVEDQDGIGPLAAMSVVSTLRRNPVFRAAAAEVLVEYAVQRMADEIASEIDPERFTLPDGTPW